MRNEQQQPGGGPRTLADDLRARADSGLATLLSTRPDLLSPVPKDLTQLATRAGTRASVVRAVERLDRFALQVAEALAVSADPCPYEALRALLTGDDPGPEDAAAVGAQLPVALGTLRDRALLWGADDRLHLVRTAREVLAPAGTGVSPTGLGPSLTEAAAGISPGRMQEILAAAGLPPTHDPVSALASLAALFADPDRTAAVLRTAPQESLAVLGKLVWGPPYGTADHRTPSAALRWLLEHGLLLPAGERTVVLPREAALRLRGGRAHRLLEPLPPAVRAARAHPVRTVDTTAAGQAFTALGTVEELLAGWETEPPSVLRAGGLGVRDLKRAAVALDLPESTTAFWADLAYSAGLVASDGEADETYAPTPAYDDWLRDPPQVRWTRLVTAWLSASRVAGLAGGRDAKGRNLAALGPGLDRGLAPDVRHRVLALLAGLAPGEAAEPQDVLDRLTWERPLRGAAPADGGTDGGGGYGGASGGAHGGAAGEPFRTRLARWTLTETELLGVTGRGALAGYARELIPAHAPAPAGAGAPAGRAAWVEPRPWGRAFTQHELGAAAQRAARALAPLLPEPLDHVLLQADLTAVAPGPLERPLAAALDLLADVESKGGATVYRFTPGSVRRALDAGRTAADVHAFLAAHSRTPVPQPLSYLIDDVARRHGRLRVGAASSYVRCDDDALLAEILADRRSAPLRPRLLAPTVLASPVPPDQLLARLREMGYAPAAESAEGDVLISRAGTYRAPHRRPPEPLPDGPPVPDTPLLTAAVRAIRAGDHAATAAHKPGTDRPYGEGSGPAGGGRGSRGGGRLKAPAARTPGGEPPRTDLPDTLATMQSAVLSGSELWIGYVNADGAASQRVIAPVRVEGGFVTAYDHTAEEVRTYPLHRITGVAELADE
ncbi:helicase C-terminal domain-containing protein [Streptomyces sp. N2-109]|uniref:Helicase C-terminal domain-containing protein n=1 Tax=Streptomyces gossypii TaxID=2883101 RepID=A0ABT2JXW5_9ACTN|nr:helicase C-terminal domain-containing protein [Streptomyces gossypii]MCT2592740.1 helicase C-terminal domain-containing protein [Streptomyces gossypii]